MAKRKRKKGSKKIKGFVQRRRLQGVAVEAAARKHTSEIFILAGAEELKEKYNFSDEQLFAWAQGTIERARALMIPGDNEQRQAEENAE